MPALHCGVKGKQKRSKWCLAVTSPLRSFPRNPGPGAPSASYWLNCITWSIIAARESGRLGALICTSIPWTNFELYKEWTVGHLRQLMTHLIWLPLLPSKRRKSHAKSHFLVLSHPSSPPLTVLQHPKTVRLHSCHVCFSAKLLSPQRSIKNNHLLK